jgi:transcriptional regulator with XRE-family HTH domain
MAIDQLSPFARLLRHYRIESGLTQEDLAGRAGLSARAISDLERGVKTRPPRVTVELPAEGLELAAEDRAALLGAVRRASVPHSNEVISFPEWLAASVQSPVAEAQPVLCPPEFRQVLEGLVGMYLDQQVQDRQINITVIMFSVGQPRAKASQPRGPARTTGEPGH